MSSGCSISVSLRYLHFTNVPIIFNNKEMIMPASATPGAHLHCAYMGCLGPLIGTSLSLAGPGYQTETRDTIAPKHGKGSLNSEVSNAKEKNDQILMDHCWLLSFQMTPDQAEQRGLTAHQSPSVTINIQRPGSPRHHIDLKSPGRNRLPFPPSLF